MSEQSEKSEQTENIKVSDPNASTKITTVEKTAKLKDSRKVELGKRLAKISRKAKERKARQQSEAEAATVEKEVKSEITDYIDFRYFIGGVGLVAGLGG